MSITLPQKQLSSGISPSANVDTSEIRRLGRAEQQRVAAIGDLGQAVTSGLMKYGEMTARNLSNQEIFQGELAYKKGMDDHDLMLATSQDMEVIKNADKLTEAESDRLQADIFSKPIYKRSRQELEQTFAAQKQSRVLKSKINSYDRVAQNFHAMVPTMTETYAADTVHGDMRFAEMMSENAPLISEAQAAAYTNQYKLQKGTLAVDTIVREARNVQSAALLQPGDDNDTAIFISEHIDTARQLVKTLDVGKKEKDSLLNHIDDEEARIKRDKNIAEDEISRKVTMDLTTMATDGKLTSIVLEQNKDWLTPSNYSSLYSSLKSTTVATPAQKTAALAESLIALNRYDRDNSQENWENALNVVVKNNAQGLLGATGNTMMEELLRPSEKTTKAPMAWGNGVDSLERMRTADIKSNTPTGEAPPQNKLIEINSRYDNALISAKEQTRGMTDDREIKKVWDGILVPVKEEAVKSWYEKWYYFGTPTWYVGQVRKRLSGKAAPAKGVITQKDYDNLPSGAQYIHPDDGTIRTKQ